MTKKLKVAVLMGGNSPEHDISLISGSEVVKNLDIKKYEVLPVTITRDGKTWQIGDRKDFINSPASKQKKRKLASSFLTKRNFNSSDIIKNHNIDVVFIAMHGAGGEDGKVQALLELIETPYTGSGVLPSALAMDKKYSKLIFEKAGLKVPSGIVVNKKTNLASAIKKLKFPAFVKPSTAGSSVGITKVKESEGLKKAVELALQFSNEALIDEYIEGTEVTCAIIGNEDSFALPLVEIVTKNDFFDYEAKYNAKLTEEITPARINDFLTKKAQKAALTAYKAIGCKGFGRVDMIIRKGEIYVLEVNTIPGLTPVSLLPKAAAAANISYQMLLDKVIQLALN